MPTISELEAAPWSGPREPSPATDSVKLSALFVSVADCTVQL